MKAIDLCNHPLFFTFMTCIGGIFYGFCLGEFFQILTYPEHWDFSQDLKNVNYCLFNSLFPSGSFIGTLISGFTSYKFGRVKTIFFTDVLTVIVLIITTSSDNFESYFIGRFIMGISSGVNLPVMILLIREFVLDQDYLRCIVCFQVSNTIGIFLSNLLCLSGEWRVPIIVSMIILFFRISYYFYLIRKKIDTPIYMLNSKNKNHNQASLKILEKIYPGKTIETLENNIRSQETLLKKEFFMGNMFSSDYVAEIIFCIAILFLNQASGINQVLGYSGLFYPNHSTLIAMIFSTVNMIGGLSLLFTIPPYNIRNFLKHFMGITFDKGFIRFAIGTLLIIVILAIFGFYIDYSADSYNDGLFIGLGSVYLLIFQHCIGCYPFIYIPVLLPDIGVFMVLLIHSTFGMIASLSFYFGSDTFPFTFRFCFVMSLIGIIIAFFLYKKFLKGKLLNVDSREKCYFSKEEKDDLIFKENSGKSVLELK